MPTLAWGFQTVQICFSLGTGSYRFGPLEQPDLKHRSISIRKKNRPVLTFIQFQGVPRLVKKAAYLKDMEISSQKAHKKENYSSDKIVVNVHPKLTFTPGGGRKARRQFEMKRIYAPLRWNLPLNMRKGCLSRVWGSFVAMKLVGI